MARPKATHEQVIEKFWSRVKKTDGCWNWQGYKNNVGYGQFTTLTNSGIFDSRYVHRFSYYLANGDYNKELEVCHTCDNPCCVKPDHLFLGTHSENMIDAYNKGRKILPDTSGENARTSKLDWNKVREIRILYSKGGVTQSDLGEEYGVTKVTISDIVNNKTWIE